MLLCRMGNWQNALQLPTGLCKIAFQGLLSSWQDDSWESSLPSEQRSFTTFLWSQWALRGAVEKVTFVLHWLDGWWITQCSRWQDRNKLMFDTQGGKVKRSENSEEGPETARGQHGLPESSMSSCGLTAVSASRAETNKGCLRIRTGYFLLKKVCALFLT